jgi:hypothetical protein
MSDLQYEYGDLLVLNVTNQTVVTNTVSPQLTLIAMKRLAQLPWIIERFYPLSEEANDCFLDHTIQLLDLFFSSSRDLNAPQFTY